MAISVMTWVWNHSRSRHGARLALLAIADCASADGGNAWPSNAEIARKAGLTDRAVRTAVAELVALGELDVQYNAGPKGCNRYRVIMGDPGRNFPPEKSSPPPGKSPQAKPRDPEDSSPPEKSSPRKNATRTPEEISPGTVIEPKPQKKTSSSSGARATRIPEDFAVTSDMADWARQEVPALIDAGRGRSETEKFRDYWGSASGQRARKTDWVKAWRNWMREADDRLGAKPRTAPGSRQQETDDLFDAAMQRARAREEFTDDTYRNGNALPVRQSALPAAGNRRLHA